MPGRNSGCTRTRCSKVKGQGGKFKIITNLYEFCFHLAVFSIQKKEACSVRPKLCRNCLNCKHGCFTFYQSGDLNHGSKHCNSIQSERMFPVWPAGSRTYRR